LTASSNLEKLYKNIPTQFETGTSNVYVMGTKCYA